MLKRALPWIFLLSGWIALAAYFCSNIFCSGNLGAATTAIESPAAATLPSANTGVWNYSDGDNFSMSHEDYFKFPEEKASYIMPLSAEFVKSLNETTSYLSGNSDRQLNITGYYLESEENTSVLPNMGLARANSVKSYLLDLGVSPGQITMKGMSIDGRWMKEGILTKGVDFAFSAKSATNDRIPNIASRLVGKPLTVYFQTNQNTLKFSESQRNDLSDMFYYLDNVSSSSLTVSGHTDNVGSRSYNLKLSQDRAAFVKNYLIERGGVNGDRLNVQGDGPDRPIMTNDTPAGRSKNRRVEITLQ